MIEGTAGLFAGAVVLGTVHGVLPDHGWPVAAMYAVERPRKWLHGFAAGFVLGFGHLISSIAVVVGFFWAKSYFGLGELGWMHYVAGLLLVLLGVREYYYGHSHGEHGHSHGSGHEHSHGGEHEQHDEHDRGGAESADARGLWGITAFAFALGFAHNEEFEIIAICTGADRCLALMFTYAMAVLIAVVAMTLLLVAGYDHYEERMEEYADVLPTLTAAVLVVMGIGFLLGVF